MAIHAEEYVLKGNEFVDEVARQLKEGKGRDQAVRLIVPVLHALRDALSPEESVHLMAGLPVYIKAAYAEGWQSSSSPVQAGSIDFFAEKLKDGSKGSEEDFGAKENCINNVKAVLHALKKYVSAGEIAHVLARLPPELQEK